jgi:hypothetical protein
MEITPRSISGCGVGRNIVQQNAGDVADEDSENVGLTVWRFERSGFGREEKELDDCSNGKVENRAAATQSKRPISPM